MEIKIRKNHKFLSSAGYIKQVCQPLELFKIHLFTYLKKFHNGGQINLSNNPTWISNYYDLSLYKTSEYEASPRDYESGFHLWPIDSGLLVFKHGREYFNSNYGFTICHKKTDGCEFYFFSFSPENYQMLNVCLSNLDLIEQFILYFNDKASSVIKDCQSHKIIIPDHQRSQKVINKIDFSHSLNDLRSTFIRAIKGNPLAKWLNNFEPLSKKEYECLNLLLTKPTANELAKALQISKRTVETHLERIKYKLQCNSKQELLMKLGHLSESTGLIKNT